MTQPSRIDGLPDLLTEEQWYDIASEHAMRDWNSDGYLESVKAVCRSAAAAQAAKQVAEGFVLVPREATMRVLEAFARTGGHHPARRWPAILDFIAAAPSATSLAEAAEAGRVEASDDRCVHGIRHPHECRECTDLRHRIAALVEQAVKDTWEGADTYMVGLCIADKIAGEVRRG